MKMILLEISLWLVSVIIESKPFTLPKVKIYQIVPGAKICRAREVYLQADTSLPFHGDAEIISETPLSLKVIPGALRVIIP